MTIADYQQSEYSHQLAELLKHPVMVTAMQICDQVSPSNGGIKQWEEPHMAHIQLGIDRGYNLYPQVLRTLAMPAKEAAPMPEPEYAAVQEKEE